MHQHVTITTTTGDHSVAEQIAADLVDRRLVACAQIGGPIRSVYRWEGTVEFTEEIVLHLKTTAEQVDAVKQVIAKLHPYDVPEVIVTPIIDGSAEYLKWIDDQTRPA
ncbi:divalent-cation tolerance protein CutA [Aeoliella sp. ICT_H6.2]|uniref:Divalent-cation tolerance protein CutA n=1 Tax=Aeoliella straminimaris TaxID=2954799 RepID=A0A9X2F789_9BACT|nr:divalent-cation tolerance protein CutA [Aeoliella straminimaris]MCO6043637.1 divalent-cation tolerance protein CutA [Aeoliella straminimaris]